MSTGPTNPTALKRWFYFTLRRLREARELSRKDAAQAIRGTVKTIEHIEVGRRLPTPLQLDKLLELYGVPDRIEFFQNLLVRAKKGRDWWVNFDFESTDLPEFFKLFLGLESEAEQIEGWDARVVPGLFQTPAYSEAVVRADDPHLGDAEVARRVTLRHARQRTVLDREKPPAVWRVIHENALRLPVGGADVARHQLETLLTLIERPNITVQILPAAAGAHTGIEGSFTFLSFDPTLEDPGLVHTETLIRSLYYEQPEELARYRKALRLLQVQACKPEETPTLIRTIMKELSTP